MTDRHGRGADLAVGTTEARGLAVTRVVGEVDLAGVDLVRAELDAQLARRPPVLVVDLTEVTILGSLGIAALLDAHHRAVAVGVRFTVVASRRSVVHPLELTEVDRVLTVVPSLDQVVIG
ncbi:STAS domain-containing protein [Saccharothrix sp. 6-C]|uniref:STAS domain-containing protein n=1 Tax=Saccharothrix sp. 6-C TaxID=2781735 RepID=UPI001916F1A8|nr:STAS domain-containing protein [Saccharothrix sp. 6-C]QQQ74326.1 STAS domain-containing protein [Saccharothrix sp. 6-C]